MGETPTRAEIEDLLGGNQEMIDLVFEASIADVLDAHLDDERLKTALFGQGIIGTWGGPYEPGTASIKLMHYQGDLDGQGPVWGYVEGGIGMVSFAIADAAQEAGAVLACGVPVAAIEPERGVVLEDGTRINARTVICNADPKVALRLLGDSEIEPAYRERLEAWKVRSPVVKFNAALERLPTWTAAPGEDWPARATIDATGTMEEAQRAFEACERGEPAVAFGEIYIQTGYDPSPAPAGKHLLSVFGQYAPLRHRRLGLGRAPRRRGPAVHRPDRALRARRRGLPDRARGPRSARHRVADRPDRRQHLPGRGDARPDVGGAAERTHTGPRHVPVRRGHAPGRERDRPERPQRRRGRARRFRSGATGTVGAMQSDARDRILEAACDLIAEEGIDDVRIARVAMRAGASTALVHHYFSTREELLEEALIHSFDQAGDERFAAEPQEETAAGRLARAIGESLPLPGPQEREWVLWVELWLRAVRDPDLRPVAARLYERYRRWLEGIIRAGVESGEFRADLDVAGAADRAMALLDGAGVRVLFGDPAMDFDRAYELVATSLAPELGIEPLALRAD